MGAQLLCHSRCPEWLRGSVSSDSEVCMARLKLEEALHSNFRHQSFRPGQLEALLPVAHGKDVFVHMPTGGGKSLCMFLVPISLGCGAVGIVISPLVGLIEQQLSQLMSLGVSAIHAVRSDQMTEIKAGKFKFAHFQCLCHLRRSLLLPEWRRLLAEPALQRRICMVAIDEAHCIHEWGESFRKSFKEIGGLRALIEAPFMALTASAPPSIEAKIISSLYLSSPVVISCDLNRPNIFLSVSQIKAMNSDLDGLAKLLKSATWSDIPKTIVYVRTKDMAWKVYHFLQQAALKRCYVGMYHADLTSHTKSVIMQDFQGSNPLRCLVATVAFGMGMDIPNIGLVVVYGSPSTVSLLYQLLGRAGRDGSFSRAHLFYNAKKKIQDKDVELFSKNSENCRRRMLLVSIGGSLEGVNEYGCCDVCSPDKSFDEQFNLFHGGVLKRKRRRAVRKVDGNLKQKLIAVREEVYKERSSFSIIGIRFLCPNSTIDFLCKEAKYIESVEDTVLLRVRPELREKFFNVITSTSSCVHTSHRR